MDVLVIVLESLSLLSSSCKAALALCNSSILRRRRSFSSISSVTFADSTWLAICWVSDTEPSTFPINRLNSLQMIILSKSYFSPSSILVLESKRVLNVLEMHNTMPDSSRNFLNSFFFL